MRSVIFISFLLVTQWLHAQEGTTQKTIDITSSFKPSLIPPKKIAFNATPAASTDTRSAISYNLQVEKLAFNFTPSPLRPLAYNDTSTHVEDKGYVKAGFGNFTTPYIKASVNLGNGINSNGIIDALYTSSKGKLPFQQSSQYGVKANSLFQLNENHALQARGGFSGLTTYRYGFRPETLVMGKDSLKLNYNDLHLGATLGNEQANELGLYYKAIVDANLFSDNNSGNEMALRYTVPLEKELTDDISMVVALSGLVSRVKTIDSTYGNNVTQLKAGVKFSLTENIMLNAALVPSWNNGSFALLPDVQIETFLNEQNLVLQAGISGSYIQNTWRGLVQLNPWIEQPNDLTHSRNTEVFAAVKAVLDEHFSFRVKAGYQRRLNVPLLVNDGGDGKTFEILWEPAMNISGVTGELIWQQGDKFFWNNQLTLQSFGGLKNAPKAYGLLPFEFTSAARLKVMDKLMAKADLNTFMGPWFQEKGGNAKQGNAVFDLSLGAEFDIMPKIKLWLQFNNLLNSQYERWNQYQVLGFQALGGAIFRF